MTVTREVECGSCRLCCRGYGHVFLGEGERASDYGAIKVLHPVTEKPSYALPHKQGGDCVYLGPHGCTIYDRRPQACRDFDCRLFAMGHQTYDVPHSEAVKQRGLELLTPNT